MSFCWRKSDKSSAVICRRATWFNTDYCDARRNCRRCECRHQPTYSVGDWSQWVKAARWHFQLYCNKEVHWTSRLEQDRCASQLLWRSLSLVFGHDPRHCRCHQPYSRGVRVILCSSSRQDPAWHSSCSTIRCCCCPSSFALKLTSVTLLCHRRSNPALLTRCRPSYCVSMSNGTKVP